METRMNERSPVGRLVEMLCLMLAVILAEAGPAQGRAEEAGKAKIHYELEFAPGGDDLFPLVRRPEWRLRVSGRGLSKEDGAVTLVFDSWGDWREVDSLYIDVRECAPPVDADLFPGNALVLRRPDGWDGRFEVSFAFQPIRAGSKASERWGMLPSWSPGYSFGQSRNVFPQVFQDHGPVSGLRTVELRAPKGCPIASGWKGLTAGKQKLEVDPADGNGFIGFGRPRSHAEFKVAEGKLEVVQYGRALEVAEPVGRMLQRLAGNIAAALDHPLPDPMLVFITDVGEGGMGSDHGLVLGFTGDTPEWQVNSPYYHHFVAHEFFHWWLGSQIRGNEAITWFHEGFTEYFSLWHLASSGLIERSWFAERVHELGREALDRSSWGSISFADPEVSWRDGDGPNEIMAYKGGAMLAFALDMELRKRKEAGALLLIRDLLERGVEEPSLKDLKAWFEGHDMQDFWESYVAGKNTIEMADLLEEIGFEIERDENGIKFTDGGDLRDDFFTFEPE